MSLWKWKDTELEIDLEDVEFQERYEKAFNKMELAEKSLQNIGKYSEITKAYCDMFFNLFDGIFGEGTSDKLFDGKKNARLVDECYDSFIAVCKKDVEAMNKNRVVRAAKYKVKVKK